MRGARRRHRRRVDPWTRGNDLSEHDLTEQDATDEGVAPLALEPRLVRPGAIGERRVVEEVLRLLGVRQGLPRRRLLRLLRLPRRCLCLRLGRLGWLALCVPDLDVVAANAFLAGFLDPLEILPVRTANPQRVIEAIAEAVRQDGVVHGRLAAVFLVDREVLEGRHPVAPPVAPVVCHLLEVARASELLRAEACGHLACELRDVPLLGCLDEGSLNAERLQLGRSRSAAFRIPLDPRHVPTLCALSPRRSVRATWLQPAPDEAK